MIVDSQQLEHQQNMESLGNTSQEIMTPSIVEDESDNLVLQIGQMEQQLDQALQGFFEECKNDYIPDYSESSKVSDLHDDEDNQDIGALMEDLLSLGSNGTQPLLQQEEPSITTEDLPTLRELHQEIALLRREVQVAKTKNQRLVLASASAASSFKALNQHARQINERNKKLDEDLLDARDSIHNSDIRIMELQEELKMKTATYIAEVHARIHYREALSDVVRVVRTKCQKADVVEEVCEIADRCDRNYGGEFPFGIFPKQGGEMYKSNPAGFASKFKSFWRVS